MERYEKMYGYPILVCLDSIFLPQKQGKNLICINYLVIWFIAAHLTFLWQGCRSYESLYVYHCQVDCCSLCSSFIAKLKEPSLIPFYKPMDYVEALAQIYAAIDGASNDEKSGFYLEQSIIFRGPDEMKYPRCETVFNINP